MSLKKFSELTHVDRGAPCQEYPGIWILYYPSPDALDPNGIEADEYSSLKAALCRAEKKLREYDSAWKEYNPLEFRICWRASYDDIRIGKTWFTPFYQHGRFNHFGQYKSG